MAPAKRAPFIYDLHRLGLVIAHEEACTPDQQAESSGCRATSEADRDDRGAAFAEGQAAINRFDFVHVELTHDKSPFEKTQSPCVVGSGSNSRNSL